VRAAAAWLLLAATAAPAHAAEVTAVYAAYWAGLPAAQLRLTLRDGDGSYRHEIEIHTEGVPRLLSHFVGTATASGRLAAGRLAEPARYDAVYDLRKRRDRHIAMRFVGRGGAVVAERGPEDTSRKPPLAEEFRRNVVDPLTALERIREALRGRGRTADGSFSIPVYDGARRFDVVGHVEAKKGAGDGVLRVELSLRPIAGFKGESSEDGDPDNAPRPVELRVSDDAHIVPLSIKVQVFFMPLVIQLHRLCPKAGECS
jgi:hypothetical protein